MKGLLKSILFFAICLAMSFLANAQPGSGITKLATESAPTWTPTSTDSKSLWAVTPQGRVWYYQVSSSTNPTVAAGWKLLTGPGGNIVAKDSLIIGSGATSSSVPVNIRNSSGLPITLKAGTNITFASNASTGDITVNAASTAKPDSTFYGVVVSSDTLLAFLRNKNIAGSTLGADITVSVTAGSGLKLTETVGSGTQGSGGVLNFNLDPRQVGFGNILVADSREDASVVALPSGRMWRASATNTMGVPTGTLFIKSNVTILLRRIVAFYHRFKYLN